MQYGLSVGSGILLYFWLNWKFDKNWRYFFFYRIIWWSEFWCVFFLIWRPLHLLIRYHLAFLTKMLKEEVVTTGIPLQVIKYPNFNWTLIVVKIVLTLASSFFDSMIFRNSSKFVVENSPKPSLLSLKCQKWMAKEFGQRLFHTLIAQFLFGNIYYTLRHAKLA